MSCVCVSGKLIAGHCSLDLELFLQSSIQILEFSSIYRKNERPVSVSRYKMNMYRPVQHKVFEVCTVQYKLSRMLLERTLHFRNHNLSQHLQELL